MMNSLQTSIELEEKVAKIEEFVKTLVDIIHLATRQGEIRLDYKQSQALKIIKEHYVNQD